jgi:acyl-CoA synthetase (AMP-forming)/AMP-acid ligase II
MNLMMLLEMAASGFGERVALGSRDGSGLTYERSSIGRAGRRACSRGGIERVSLVDVSSSALPIALFGSAWAGKPFVPLNYRLTAERAAPFGDRSGAVDHGLRGAGAAQALRHRRCRGGHA